MILTIDGYEANTTHRVGIGEYASEILQGIYAILQARGQKNTTTVRIYLPDAPLPHLPPPTPWWKYCVRRPRKLWTVVTLPSRLLVEYPRPDVIFSPTHYIPRFTSIPRVMSIMDMSFLHYPDLFRKKDYYQLLNWTRYSALRAQAICTISEFSRNAIIEAYHVSPDRVFVTYPGLRAKKITSMESSSHYSLNNPYILSVGTLQPRKNYVKLIEAFSQLKQQKEYQHLDLVIVGKKGWLYEDILSAPKRYGVESSVKFLDFIPDEHLPELYSKAECFVLASLYEGFGLPVLEAMANGCMVVVSNNSSLPEIAGDAGIYIEPEKIESIVEGIQTALKEKQTTVGKKRIEKGKDRLKLFQWQKAAQQTLEVLEDIGKRKMINDK